MKRIYLYSLIMILSVVCYGCMDVLDKQPLDEISPGSYWESASDLKLYINQFYPSFGSHHAYYGMDSHSGNMVRIPSSELLNGTRSVPTTGGGWNWNNIRQVNNFLVNASKVTEGTVDLIKQYKGEGYFFRAYFYFKKLKRFGAVPIYRKPLDTNSEGLYASRDPRNKVVNFIISDLNKAIKLLNLKSQLPSNRVNKGVAILFKSRVTLYEGTWEKYHYGTAFGVEGSHGKNYLKVAAKSAKRLMESGRFSLYSTGQPKKDYYKLFNRVDLSDNSGVLLWSANAPDLDLGGGAWTYLNGGRGSSNGISKQMVSSYLSIDGLPIALSSLYRGDTTLRQVVKNRDPRLKQSMWVPGQVRIAYSGDPLLFKHPPLAAGAQDMATTGYMVRKGSTTDPDQNKGSSSADYGKTDGIVFRYAEALLNYAEAKAELGTITQADLNMSVNLLRERVGMPPMHYPVQFTDPNWLFPDLSPIINEIRRERRVELAFEGFRYDDLMRWAAGEHINGLKLKGARVIPGESFPAIQEQISDIPVDKNGYIWRYKNSMSNGFQFNVNRDYLYPIPTRALTLNDSLKQNPGWK